MTTAEPNMLDARREAALGWCLKFAEGGLEGA